VTLSRRLGARPAEAHALRLAADVASAGDAEGAEGCYRPPRPDHALSAHGQSWASRGARDGCDDAVPGDEDVVVVGAGPRGIQLAI